MQGSQAAGWEPDPPCLESQGAAWGTAWSWLVRAFKVTSHKCATEKFKSNMLQALNNGSRAAREGQGGTMMDKTVCMQD